MTLTRNSSGSEGSRRESILAWRVWLSVPSMRYIRSPDMVKNKILGIISGTRVPFEST